MKYLRQLLLLMLFWALGECLSIVISPWFPLPGTIAGMLIMFMCLYTGLLKEAHIQDVSDFFLAWIALFFVPPCVGILKLEPSQWAYIPSLIFIATLTTLITMGVTAIFLQRIMKGEHRE